MERASLKELGSKSLLDVNRDFLEAHGDSLKHRAAAAEISLLLSPEAKSEAIKIVEDSSEDHASSSGVPPAKSGWLLKDCVAVHQLLEISFKDAAAASRWSARCAELFPYSIYFKGAKSSAVVGVANTIGLNHSDKVEVESGRVGEKDLSVSVNGCLRDLALN